MAQGILTGGNTWPRALSALAAVAVVGSLRILPTPMGRLLLYSGGGTVWSDLAHSHIQPHALN